MNNFSCKDIYIEEGRRVLEINILSEKNCNFDCIFCPIGRTQKVDTQKTFDNFENSLAELEKIIKSTEPELIFFNSKGESLINDRIADIINFVKNKGLSVKLFSNGYLLGKDEYRKIANTCDEVVGEVKMITEEEFLKIQRPIDGYTLKEYISNMASFKKQYAGKFILEITVIKGYNDDEKAVQRLKEIVKEISPNEVRVGRIDDARFKNKLGITDEKLEEISKHF